MDGSWLIPLVTVFMGHPLLLTICHDIGHGGLTFVRHNEILGLTTDWLSVCYDVVIEPPLQQFTGDTIVPANAN